MLESNSKNSTKNARIKEKVYCAWKTDNEGGKHSIVTAKRSRNSASTWKKDLSKEVFGIA